MRAVKRHSKDNAERSTGQYSRKGQSKGTLRIMLREAQKGLLRLHAKIMEQRKKLLRATLEGNGRAQKDAERQQFARERLHKDVVLETCHSLFEG